MGIIKNTIEAVVEEAIIDAGVATAVGAISAVEAAGNAVSKGIGKVVENRNLANLKKHSKNQDYCLFVNKETKFGDGIYVVIDKKKKELYNTLIDSDAKGDFTLHLYSKHKGKIADITKTTVVKKGLFTSNKYTTDYVLHSDIHPYGMILETYEGKTKIYTTSFNDWIITGEFSKGNYKIFDKRTGKTIAAISKKYKSASTFIVDCDLDKNESTILLITILLDMIS